MQKRSDVPQSRRAWEQTNAQRSRFACAVVRQLASPPAQIVSPSAIRRQARTSRTSALWHAWRQVVFVFGMASTHDVSRVTHLLAQVTPAPVAKHLEYAVSKSVRQVVSPLRRHSRLAWYAARTHDALAGLNGCGGSVVVVVVVAVCAKPCPTLA